MVNLKQQIRMLQAELDDTKQKYDKLLWSTTQLRVRELEQENKIYMEQNISLKNKFDLLLRDVKLRKK